jgi:small subunit ribosomal protein S4
MARLIDPKCRQCRHTGEKLFLKGERCFTPKCAIIRRTYPPGARGKAGAARKRSSSEYGQQLVKKQSIKKTYGIMERQLKRYFREASLQKGDTREILLRKLEMRLDNVVFRLGWVKSRAAARQLVNHGHVLINNRRVTIPSGGVKAGDVISLKDTIKKSKLLENLAVVLKKYEPPTWLALDKEKIDGKVIKQPGVEDLNDLAPIGLIVEFYSR